MSGAATLTDFLRALHPPDSEGFIDLRALPSKAQAFIRRDDIEAVERFIRAHASENLYFGVAARKSRSSGKLKNCGLLHDLFSDIDFTLTPESEARAKLEGFLLKPSIVVRSGGGLHCYWLLREPLNLQDPEDCARAKKLLRRLALALGGDLGSAEPAHILRIPGTLNRKPEYGTPRPVVIEAFNPERYNPSDFDDLLPAEPEPTTNGNGRGFAVGERIKDHERNDTLYRLARSLKAKGLSEAAILAAARAENDAKCDPPMGSKPDDEKVEDIVGHVMRQPDRPEFVTTAKVPPQSIDSEMTLLGAILQWSEPLEQARQALTARDFSLKAHGLIYAAACELAEAGESVNFLTLEERLHSNKQLEAVGDRSYLKELCNAAATPELAPSAIRLIREKSTLRTLIEVTQNGLERAYNGKPSTEVFEAMQASLASIEERATGEERPFTIKARDAVAEPVEMLIEDLLPAGMLTLLSGKDKRGKTLLAQEMIKAVLTGQPFLGYFAAHCGPVIAAFLDDPFSLTLERLRTLGIKEHLLFDLVSPLGFDGDAGIFLSKLERAVKRLKPVLIVIDALYQLVPPGANAGNDQARMGPLMGRLNRLAETSGATVSIVCHDDKGGVDVAGSHVVRAAAKAIFRLTLPRGEETSADDGPLTPRRILRVESKVEAASAWALECHGCGQWGFLGEADKVRASDTLEVVRQHLADGNEGTRNEIAEATSKRGAEVGKALKALCDEGYAVTHKEVHEKGRPKTIYSYNARDFRSQPSDHKKTPDQKSSVQLIDSQGEAGIEDFRSRFSPLRPGIWDRKSNGASEPIFEEV